jgi:hypothetical protein
MPDQEFGVISHSHEHDSGKCQAEFLKITSLNDGFD